MKLKIRLYAASVCSLLIYGAETWILHEAVQRKIRGANSLMLARIPYPNGQLNVLNNI